MSLVGSFVSTAKQDNSERSLPAVVDHTQDRNRSATGDTAPYGCSLEMPSRIR
jgi:hypothetical protein